MDDHDHRGDAGHGHDHSRDHGHTHREDHEHGHHEHEADEEPDDVSAWIASTQKLSCPACGALGALSLGGGTFCPACGEVTTNPGYQAPTQAPEPESGPD